MFSRLKGVLLAAVSASSAHAADVVYIGDNPFEQSIVYIVGELVDEDIAKFSSITADMSKALIVFNSGGGSLQAGLDIGERIRFRGYDTAVRDTEDCHSACALALMGGITRHIGEDANVSFHAAYVFENGVPIEKGSGNALVGSYLSKLGLNEDAILYVTDAPPDGGNPLTEDIAGLYGISADFGPLEEITEIVRGNPELAEDEAEPESKTSQTLTEEEYGDAGFPEYISTAELDDLAVNADNGDVDAAFQLGYRYGQGYGVQKNFYKAVTYYEIAALKGDGASQHNLGLLFIEEGNSESYRTQGVDWLTKAGQNGFPQAYLALGKMYALGQYSEVDEEKGFELILKSATEGDFSESHYWTGLCYLNGWGTKKNPREAAKWLMKAAEKGDEFAAYEVGILYKDGTGLPVDYDKAFTWMKKSAETGYGDALYELSVMYDEGTGVPEDDVKALKLMSESAYAGVDYGLFHLAFYFDSGTGVTQNSKIAADKLIEYLAQQKTEEDGYGQVLIDRAHLFTSDAIYYLQLELADKGYYKGRPDGQFGPGTAQAVMDYAAYK